MRKLFFLILISFFTSLNVSAQSQSFRLIDIPGTDGWKCRIVVRQNGDTLYTLDAEHHVARFNETYQFDPNIQEFQRKCPDYTEVKLHNGKVTEITHYKNAKKNGEFTSYFGDYVRTGKYEDDKIVGLLTVTNIKTGKTTHGYIIGGNSYSLEYQIIPYFIFILLFLVSGFLLIRKKRYHIFYISLFVALIVCLAIFFLNSFSFPEDYSRFLKSITLFLLTCVSFASFINLFFPKNRREVKIISIIVIALLGLMIIGFIVLLFNLPGKIGG